MGDDDGATSSKRLATEARAGSKDAFDALQRSLEPAVRRFVRRLIGPNEAEDDLVREAFLALYVGLPRLRDPERVRPFVFRVARNLAYNELRRQGRFRLVPLDSGDNGEGPGGVAAFLRDASPTPDETLERVTAMAELRQAIDRLPEPQRQALILYAEEEMPYAEVAEVLGTDVNNVKARIHHARRALARRLTPDTLRVLGVAPPPPLEGFK
jgi:RNA polymerase sigma-70 factor (ECF subfamily)